MKLTAEQEREILRECIEKDECYRIFRQYLNLVRSIAIKIYRSKGVSFTSADMEDRVQDVFEVLFKYNKQKLRQYDPQHGLRFEGWIRLIAAQTVLDYFKRKKEFLNITDEKIRIPVEDMDMISGEKRAGTSAETQCIMADAIEKLPPDQKLVLKMEYFKGLSPQEIAKYLGKTVNNIYQIKTRALESLRKILG